MPTRRKTIMPAEYEPEEGNIGDAINLLIDRALVASRRTEKARTYMGGSQAGKQCLRSLRYDWESQLAANSYKSGIDPYANTRHEHVNGKMCRRTELGHAHEAITAAWLRMANFDLQTHDDEGEQLGYKDAWHEGLNQHMLAGNIDGKVLNGPLDLPYPMLWEHKIMRSDLWRKCKKLGCAVAYPDYYTQAQVYMGYMDLELCMFTGLNTDTSELQFEFIRFDREHAQWGIDRLLDVVQAESHEEFPRIGNTPSYYICNMCKHKARCWAGVDTNG